MSICLAVQKYPIIIIRDIRIIMVIQVMFIWGDGVNLEEMLTPV